LCCFFISIDYRQLLWTATRMVIAAAAQHLIAHMRQIIPACMRVKTALLHQCAFSVHRCGVVAALMCTLTQLAAPNYLPLLLFVVALLLPAAIHLYSLLAG
jgi:hypothetical protein